MTAMSLSGRRVATAGLFVVGRFRSGTTVIWNVLRHIPGVRPYYEPCHDSLLEHLRLNSSPDPTHVRVSEYWKEYAPIMANLPRYYRKEFGIERLCLPEGAEHAELKDYLDFLLASGSTDEIACLKLNRMDLRLPWLRNNFPDTPVVYIYRDPRDQWVSIFRAEHGTAIDDPYLNTGYDLMIWSANLFPYVPRLGSSTISSSYERHYLIWRISLELAKVYADCIINFEQELQDEPERGLVKLLHMLGRDDDAHRDLRDLIVSAKRNTWEAYHQAHWFADIEGRCDRYLEEAGILRQIGEKTVFSTVSGGLSSNAGDTLAGLVFPLCRVISQCRSVALEHAGRLTSSLQHAQVYIKQLEDEVDKITRDSQAGLLDRDRELERRSEAYTHLAGSLERMRQDAADEIARRDYVISVKDRLVSSLQQEIDKTVTDAKTQIDGRDHAAAEKDAYIKSLEQELAKFQRDAALEIHTRDEMLEQKDHYIRSLEQKVRELQDNPRAR
jgi:hypothetical protein